MNSFRAVERALDYEAARQYREWQETRPAARRRAQANPRLGRRGRRHPRPAQQGRIERLPLLPRSRPGAGDVHAGRGRGGQANRSASCRPRCARGWNRTTACSAYDADVLVNQGRPVVDYFLAVADACRRRQGGQQLGHAGRAAGAQGAQPLDRRIASFERGTCRSDRKN